MTVRQRWAGAKWGRRAAGAMLAAATVAVAWPASLHGQASRTVQDGVFTEAQAARGQAIYAKQCASCHGADLKGAQAPPLVGDPFLAGRGAQPLASLASKIRNTMPADAQGQLTAAQTVDLLSHLLKAGGFPAGRTELVSDEKALAAIGWPQRPAARAATSGTTQVKTYPPLGNMAQLMRGIFFPNSNLIFTVQTRDPAEPVKAATGDTPATGFSFVDWGAGIYGGWQLVDNAAIALADASPLMLVPGTRCENGRLAPVTDADWIKFTEDLIAVSRKTFQASQARSQDAVSEATGDLSDACAACHRAYRDVQPIGATPDPNDPSNKASRCRPRR
jgi:mono/diheme cytochrome c family protein